MVKEIFWRLPTHGDSGLTALGLYQSTGTGRPYGYWQDGDGVSRDRRDRYSYGDYLARVTKAAETTGFDGVLLPPVPSGDEPFITAGSLLRETKNLKFLPSFHTAIGKPVHISRQTATLGRHSGGRIEWNILTGENEILQRRQGDFTSLTERITRNEEFIDIARGVFTSQDFSYNGAIYQVDQGGLQKHLVPYGTPRIFLSGTSSKSLTLAAHKADVYLSRLLPELLLRKNINILKEKASSVGRALSVALRADVIIRPTKEEALSYARYLHENQHGNPEQWPLSTVEELDGLHDEQEALAPWHRQSNFEDRFIDETLFVSRGLTRNTAAITFVGTAESVAERLLHYADGVADILILAAPGHLEEAYRTGEDLLPLLKSEAVKNAA